MGKIFISYRREDSQDFTERIHDRLVRNLKDHKIFLDVERGNIPIAAHYKDVLVEAVQQCDVLVVIIGSKWLEITDPLTGKRRLEHPDDFVRLEVTTGLANNHTKVILVFLHDAPIFKREDLPLDLQPMLDLQIARVRRNPDFHRHMDDLEEDIQRFLPKPTTGITPRFFLISLFIAILLTASLMYLVFASLDNDPLILPTQNPETIAVQLLTEIAKTANAPTLTPTQDITQTIEAIMVAIQGSATYEANSGVDSPPTQTITQTSLPSATASLTASPTLNLTSTAERQAALSQQNTQVMRTALSQLNTQESQLTANAPTNTPIPTATPSRTASPTRTMTPTATVTPTFTLTLTPTVDSQRATQVYEFAIATLDAQITATAEAFLTQQYGELIFYRDGETREIYAIELDGSQERNLTSNGVDDLRPNWSQDGRLIAFDSYRNNQRDLYIMNPDGSNQTPLTNDEAVENAPSWSPDGSKVAYSAYKSVQSDFSNIYVYDLNAETNPILQLTDNQRLNASPSWSSDGNRLVFSSNRDGDWKLYVMNADGSDQRLLGDEAVRGINPVWSPTRPELAFANANTGSFEIYLIDEDGSNQRPLTQNGADNLNPSWSSDGNWLAFQSNLDGDYDIYLISRDGTHLRQVTFTEAVEHYPSWNPFITVTDELLNATVCEGFLPSRMDAGQAGVVIASVSLNMRAEAAIDGTLLQQLFEDDTFLVLEGPVCADQLAWWRIEHEGTIGWVSEGRADMYWIEPLPATPALEGSESGQ